MVLEEIGRRGCCRWGWGVIPQKYMSRITEKYRSGPAGGNSRSPRKSNVISTGEVEMMDSLGTFSDGLVVKKNDKAIPLSAEAEVFSPEAVPSGGAPFAEGPESDRTPGHPREMTGRGGGVFGR